MSFLRVALVQLTVGSNKVQNVNRALQFIGKAKEKGANLVVLPECFNSPYGIKFFPEYAEPVPNGETCKKLAEAAKEHSIAIIGGSLPEVDENGKLYNTCPVFNAEGEWIGKFRKMHLFNINIPGKITFRESDALEAGSGFLTLKLNSDWKIGIGICFDVRFPEFANYYTDLGCNFLVYPGAFNTVTGPPYWQLLQQARAVDNQLFVATCSPARNKEAGYLAYGHSMAVDPWGKILGEAQEDEEMIVVDLDSSEVGKAREAVPTRTQRRPDIYYAKN